jgi:hypothetical protein
METKSENPSAFPHTDGINIEGQGQTYEGMSLRDYFAAKAMQAYASIQPSKTGLNAELAYRQAEEMLKARG